MDNRTRQVIVAILAATAVFIGSSILMLKLSPPPPRPPQETTSQAAPGTGTPEAPAPTTGSAGTPATTGSGGFTATVPAQPVATGPAYHFVGGAEVGPLELGGRDRDALRIELNARGGGLATLELWQKDGKGRFVYGADVRSTQPYQMLNPVEGSGRVHYSFATARLRIEEHKLWYNLDDFVWRVSEQSAERVVFTTTLSASDGNSELLRLTKTYTLEPNRPVFTIDLRVEAVGPTPLTVQLEQDAALGIREEGPSADMRKLLATQWTDNGIELSKSGVRTWAELQKVVANGQPEGVELLRPGSFPFGWTALANKYFAAYTRPLPPAAAEAAGTSPLAAHPDQVVAVRGLVVAPYVTTDPADLLSHGDLVARMVTRPVQLATGAVLHLPFEVYAGPKDAEHLSVVNPLYAERTGLDYQVARSADLSCFCTFLWLQELMVWLLHRIHFVVRNYGVAIFFLVLLVKGILHPLSVWQQKNMFRMQEANARMQPKMEALKERFANDKVRLNQETMRLWSEEGVNPMASVFSMLPMLVQMPILVALWSSLNTDVSLRHAPFDGWWIKDLSAPDALFSFAHPLTVPVLGWTVTSLNLLPVLMGVSMWLQQKYMPKPRPHASATPARQHAKGGMTPEDTMRQQQMMVYLMSALLPIMLYKQPSGLNLYWMASNIVGILESLRIRHQIELERTRRAAEGPPLPKSPSVVSRVLKSVVARAEEIQRKADELGSTDESKRGKKRN